MFGEPQHRTIADYLSDISTGTDMLVEPNAATSKIRSPHQGVVANYYARVAAMCLPAKVALPGVRPAMRWIHCEILKLLILLPLASVASGADSMDGERVPRFVAQSGHLGQITDLKYSHDGKLLASEGEDQTVRIWDVASGRELRNFTAYQYETPLLAFSPDDKMLATRTKGANEVAIWDIASGRLIQSFFVSGASAAEFNPGGQVILVGGDSGIAAQDFQSNKKNYGYIGLDDFLDGRVTSLAVSPDGDYIAAGSEDHIVRVWKRERVARAVASTQGAHQPDQVAGVFSRQPAACIWQCRRRNQALECFNRGGGPEASRGRTRNAPHMVFLNLSRVFQNIKESCVLISEEMASALRRP